MDTSDRRHQGHRWSIIFIIAKDFLETGDQKQSLACFVRYLKILDTFKENNVI